MQNPIELDGLSERAGRAQLDHTAVAGGYVPPNVFQLPDDKIGSALELVILAEMLAKLT